MRVIQLCFRTTVSSWQSTCEIDNDAHVTTTHEVNHGVLTWLNEHQLRRPACRDQCVNYSRPQKRRCFIASGTVRRCRPTVGEGKRSRQSHVSVLTRDHLSDDVLHSVLSSFGSDRFPPVSPNRRRFTRPAIYRFSYTFLACVVNRW